MAILSDTLTATATDMRIIVSRLHHMFYRLINKRIG